MEWVWTWSGGCFGWIQQGNLWTHNGKHVGQVRGGEIFGPNGSYIGELMGERLITNIGKKSWQSHGFAPSASTTGYVRYTNYVGYVMCAGYEDFPAPDKL